MAPQLDFFFYIGSTYTYLSVMRIDELAARMGVSVNWRPFNIRAVLTDHPFQGKPAKTKYMWRDIERRAARHGIAWNGIPEYPIEPANLANRLATVAFQDGWGREFVQQIYRSWFLKNQNFGKTEVVSAVLTDMGKDPASMIARAESKEIRNRYIEETEIARSLGLVGAPSFVSGTEVFWGDDHLEEAFEWALTSSSRSSAGP
ncbi:2-hydroxychromene-2-carboxylate isomerase [Noviherbaspirillum aerium]|uniref:2-hydroxychromene-2-carboxylate isomerase n=1 Tax=Noviherbaspirillum aerium TaxID=2588497 RepID=UPI00124C05D4|nr:2-hydroxychromene-2-carboxylate isomerase [Noviherbaspirillum aerium]